MAPQKPQKLQKSQIHEDEPTLAMAPGVNIIARDDSAIQFGLDAARSGVIVVDNAHTVVKLLRSVPPICRRANIVAALGGAGVPEAAAGAVVDELLAFGIWRPTRATDPIILIGSTPLARDIGAGLWSDGFKVRSPGDSSTTASLNRYIASQPADVPVIIVDMLHRAHPLSVNLKAHMDTWLPVTQFDHRVLLGPLHKNGSGPCLLCLNLYRSEVDPLWPDIVTRAHHRLTATDPLVSSTAVAQIVAVARALVGRPPLHGTTPVRWTVGDYLDVDMFSGNQRTVLTRHPRCPVCFATTVTGAAGGTAAGEGPLSNRFHASVSEPFVEI